MEDLDRTCDSCNRRTSTIYLHEELPVRLAKGLVVAANLCYNCHKQAKNNKEYRAEWLQKFAG